MTSQPLPPGLPSEPSASYLREYAGDTLRNVAYAFMFCVVAFVALRFYARSLSKSKVGADDLLLIPGGLCNIGICILSLAALHIGFIGRHTLATNPDLAVTGFKALIGFLLLYSFAVAFTKMSILTFFLRLFPKRTFRHAVYVLMFSVCGLCLSSVLVVIFQCQPIALAWDKTIKGGSCIDMVAFFRYSIVPNVVTDVAMLILPLPIVWNLHASFAQRAGLTAVFLTGSIGLVATCIRMGVFFRHNPYTDSSWGSVEWLVWAIIEPCMYILAASLPSYQILIVGGLIPWARKITSSNNKSKKTYGSVTKNGLSIDNDKRPFSILRDSGDLGSISVLAGFDGNEASLRPTHDRSCIPLDTIQVKHGTDVNHAERLVRSESEVHGSAESNALV